MTIEKIYAIIWLALLSRGVSFLLGERKMALPKRKNIILACTECQERNYASSKNTAANPERIEITKFCKRCGKRTVHKETK